MRGLSLTQPWATLIALGVKQMETRSWWTAYRGPLAIHAAKAFPEGARELCFEEPFHNVLRRAGYGDADAAHQEPLPRGAIVAVADLAACISTNHEAMLEAHLRLASPFERAFGDFTSGRYAWVLRAIRPLREPLPCRGYPNVWPVDEALEHAIMARVGR